MQTGATVSCRKKIHNDAVKKRFVVHALDDEDWSPRFPRLPLSASDWTARILELIDEGGDWFKSRGSVASECAHGGCASFCVWAPREQTQV